MENKDSNSFLNKFKSSRVVHISRANMRNKKSLVQPHIERSQLRNEKSKTKIREEGIDIQNETCDNLPKQTEALYSKTSKRTVKKANQYLQDIEIDAPKRFNHETYFDEKRTELEDLLIEDPLISVDELFELDTLKAVFGQNAVKKKNEKEQDANEEEFNKKIYDFSESNVKIDELFANDFVFIDNEQDNTYYIDDNNIPQTHTKYTPVPGHRNAVLNSCQDNLIPEVKKFEGLNAQSYYDQQQFQARESLVPQQFRQSYHQRANKIHQEIPIEVHQAQYTSENNHKNYNLSYYQPKQYREQDFVNNREGFEQNYGMRDDGMMIKDEYYIHKDRNSYPKQYYQNERLNFQDNQNSEQYDSFQDRFQY